MNAISGPVALYSNVPIHTDYYQPSKFDMTAMSLGATTTVTTSVAHNYVVGQKVRLIIPTRYGAYGLNESSGYVISIPSTTQVQLDIRSVGFNLFIPNPFTATITGSTKASHCVLTCTNNFIFSDTLTISGIVGMTELNGNTYRIFSLGGSSVTLNVSSLNFSSYVSGGVATVYNANRTPAQILAIGDINSGIISSTGNISTTTYIPGSFNNIS